MSWCWESPRGSASGSPAGSVPSGGKAHLEVCLESHFGKLNWKLHLKSYSGGSFLGKPIAQLENSWFSSRLSSFRGKAHLEVCLESHFGKLNWKPNLKSYSGGNFLGKPIAQLENSWFSSRLSSLGGKAHLEVCLESHFGKLKWKPHLKKQILNDHFTEALGTRFF